MPTIDVDPYEVVGGVPAKRIRYRFSPGSIERLLRIKWWDWPESEIIERQDFFKQPFESPKV